MTRRGSQFVILMRTTVAVGFEGRTGELYECKERHDWMSP